MRGSKVIGAFIAVFFAFSGMQLFFWEFRAPKGWRPAWWQSNIWAHFGMLLFLPASLGAAIVLHCFGDPPVAVRRAIFALAYCLYVLLAYWATEFVARWLLRQFSAQPQKT